MRRAIAKIIQSRNSDISKATLLSQANKQFLHTTLALLMIVFALNTGLRQDELLSLEWSCVILLRRTILIRKTKNYNQTLFF